MEEERFSLDTIQSSTSQVLQECLDIFQSPIHQQYIHSPINNSQSYNNHPDIQYFQKVKHKNHFTYHKSKSSHSSPHLRTGSTGNIDKIQSSNRISPAIFDPYNLDALLNRLHTFNVLSWQIPDIPNTPHQLNELKCARNGWKCVSLSPNETTKNHLMCTNCNQQLILNFFEHHQYPQHHIYHPTTTFNYEFLTDDVNIEDTTNLHQKLIQKYIIQIESTGHAPDCSWKNFETPLDGVYYPRHYLPQTNEFLISQYLKNLKSLTDNSTLLQQFADDALDQTYLSHSINQPPSDPRLISISNEWLIARYFKQDKENSALLLQYTPAWIYEMAIYGWTLYAQRYAQDVILLLACNMCNSRVFLNTVPKEHVGNLPPSTKILPSVKYPITQMTQVDESEFDSEESISSSVVVGETGVGCEKKFNPIDKHEHKCWCPYRYDESLVDYIWCMILQSGSNIGLNGEFINHDKMIIENISSRMMNNNNNGTGMKRKKSFSVNDGLERLQKLRKLYLIDD
ncbi:uncharacterized protein J8A68_001583 [[Candida] subhashii]|uniref:C3HC-type domain-containing protein n=1 Tax=[Candida] subhashii TaxID=561895 RepID=A0A8J5QQR9_9ASCO|nr:uncharacterized protein J8A68_001583 [[Candida] subhashii]KAG7664890.1 hypothetical protein J8A68_001583 [[Candida] subhashii]